MQTLKELLLSQVLREKKEHLIKKLNIPEDKKSKLISFFEKHPNLENKINWNKKDLNWDDFEKALNFREEKAKKIEKSLNIEGFKENEDYQILHGNSKMNMIQPLTYEFEVWLQSNNELGSSTKWCIGYELSSSYWDSYITKCQFVCFWNTKRKIMAQIKPEEITFWNEQDEDYSYEELDESLKNLIDMNDFKNFNLKNHKPVWGEEVKGIPNHFREYTDYISNNFRGVDYFIPLSFEFLQWFASNNDFGWEVDWSIVNPSEWNESVKRNILYILTEEEELAHRSKELYEINYDDRTIYAVYPDGSREPYKEYYPDKEIENMLDHIYNAEENTEWEREEQPKLFEG